MNEVYYKVKTSLNKKYLIALISDLHSNSGRLVMYSLKRNLPSIIAIVGDFVDASLRKFPKSIRFLEQCVGLAPTFFALGNHDYLITKDDLDYMKSIGVHVLNDEWEYLNDEIVVGGLTSSFYHKCEHHDPLEQMKLYPEMDWLSEFEKQDRFKILLDHHPENYDLYTRNKRIDLILSGHNHGGQIRIFGKGLYARNQGIFPKYDGGVYENRLVVGRGLSNTMFVPRLFNPVELVYIDLI